LSTLVHAQCDFKKGDIAFTGYQTFDDNIDGTVQDDVFSFVLLKDAPGDLEIFFTDLGWTNSNKFQAFDKAPSDGIIKWTAPSDGLAAGTQITIKAKFGLDANLGTVIGVQSTSISSQYLSHGIAGDQVFAYTGTKDLPVLLAGININKNNWDLELSDNSIRSSGSI